MARETELTQHAIFRATECLMMVLNCHAHSGEKAAAHTDGRFALLRLRTGAVKVHSSLLSVVLNDQPHILRDALHKES